MATKALPYGPGNAHVIQSHGADNDPLKFYITGYSTSFKHGNERYVPRKGMHHGTGYKSNFRAGVYYNRKLDELDNPNMGRLVADNYASITKKHFRPSTGSNGRDPFSQGLTLRSSGFCKDIPVTTPRSHQVAETFFDTRSVVYPKKVPLLQRIQPKDPISLENNRQGPGYMSTENHSKYHGLQNVQYDTSTKTVGRKEGSGFTHAYNDEPVTYRPMVAFSPIPNGPFRPTGVSVMKTSYQQYGHTDGTEKFPLLSKGSERGTGFTREAMGKPAFYIGKKEKVYEDAHDMPPLVQERMKKQNPIEFLNIENPHNKTSITSLTFKGLQQDPQNLAQRLGNGTMGNKELTGFTENNGQYFEQFETPQTLKRFKTTYGVQFFDKNPQGGERYGRTAGQVLSLQPDGFTKSTSLHDNGPEIDRQAQLQNLHPYVARSIKKRDPLYLDMTHHAKSNATKLAM